MTPLKRAARALCLADGLDPDRKFKSSDWSEGTAPHEFAWHEYLPKASAVLTALREPSEGMREQGAGQLFGSASDDWGDDARLVWQAMIDAALAEGE